MRNVQLVMEGSIELVPIDERLHEHIAAKVTREILDATPMIFSFIKERILELMVEWLRTFRAEIVAGQVRVHTPHFGSSRHLELLSSLGLRTPSLDR